MSFAAFNFAIIASTAFPAASNASTIAFFIISKNSVAFSSAASGLSAIASIVSVNFKVISADFDKKISILLRIMSIIEKSKAASIDANNSESYFNIIAIGLVGSKSSGNNTPVSGILSKLFSKFLSKPST